MNKNDLKLIAAFIDSKNPKLELNYAHLKSDGIYATDTKKLIKFSIPMLSLNCLVEKRIFDGFIKTCDKTSLITFDGFGNIRKHGLKMSCDTFDGDVVPVDFDKILDGQSFPHQFFSESIGDLQFELAQRNCFIDEEHLNPIIAFAECTGFNIFYEEQKETIVKDVPTKNSGIVKIVGRYSTEDELNIVKFIAVVMGRTFESKAIEE